MKTFLQNKGISLYKLSKDTGISYSTLYYIINHKIKADNCSVKNLNKIAKALNISLDTVYLLLNK